MICAKRASDSRQQGGPELIKSYMWKIRLTGSEGSSLNALRNGRRDEGLVEVGNSSEVEGLKEQAKVEE